MKIKITENNREKLENALMQVNGKAWERLAHFEDLEKAIGDIERKFDIPKCRMGGLRVRVDLHSQSVPRAYKYKMEYTHLTLDYGKKAVYLVDCERERVDEHFRYRVEVFPDGVKEAILAKYEKFYLW